MTNPSFTVQIERLYDDVSLPSYHTEGDAGLDLCAAEDTHLEPGERSMIKTGLAFAIPERYAGLIWDRSGLSMKYGLKTLGGIIDSGYRGEVMVGIINLSRKPYTIKKGDRVAQMVFQSIERATVQAVDDLDKTERGEKGIGSSGK